MQISILNGIYAKGADLRTSLPVNWKPVPKDSGASKGFLRPADGIVPLATGPGVNRGGINWNGAHYRVMGAKLVRIAPDGVVTPLGTVANDGKPVRITYGFDHLAIVSAGKLYLWNGAMVRVTDPDLGAVRDGVWIAGYFMTTDGEYLVVTDLADPTSVNPLRYGSSEADPDPIQCVFNLRGEAVAVNRYTIESYQNVGGTLFPFQRIDGAQVTKGACGTFAACPFMDVIAFVGGGRNEPVSVYLGADGAYRNVSTHEIDTILEGYSERQLASVEVEARTDKAHRLLYIHLPDRTLVYDAAASEALGEPVWFVLVSTLDGFERYRARGMVYAGGQWTAGDPASAAVGVLSDDVSSHWGEPVRWEFGTPIVYNEAAGAIFNELELIALTGNAAVGANPVISTSYSLDGVEWSSDRTICAGRTGDRNKRLVWFGQGFMRKWRIQRFRGTSDAHMSVARLEARLEPLAY